MGPMEAHYSAHFFGEPSAGYATFGVWPRLLDGTMIGLSDSWRTTVGGQSFPERIPPDVAVDGWTKSAVEEEWI
jgi:C-terminal processing protease CtpA/Prc